MRSRLFVFTVLLVSGFAVLSVSQEKPEDKAGTTAAAWLKIGVSARAAGMGEAYTAVCYDASAIFWNPANLSRVRNVQVMSQYGLWLANMGYHALSFTIPINKSKNGPGIPGGKVEKSYSSRNQYSSGYYNSYYGYPPYYGYGGYLQPEKTQKEVLPPGGTIGVGVNYFDYGSLTGYDTGGIKTQDFTANSYCAMISYSTALGEAIGVGITAKMISETIDTEPAATAFAGDIGLALTTGSEGNISIGVVMQNMGATLAGSELPQNTKAGIGIHLGPLTLSGDYSMPNDHAPKINAGAEFNLGVIALRGGMVAMDDVGGKGLFGLSAGIGLNLGGLCMDVAYVPFGDYLKDTIRASIIIGF